MKAWVILCAALVSMPAWAINKCTGPDGKATYQESKCVGHASEVSVKSQVSRSETTSLDDRINRATKECRVNKLPEYPEIGWSEERFLQCSVVALSDSPKINITETAAGVSKQYVFRYYRAYVYVRGGLVVAVQR